MSNNETSSRRRPVWPAIVVVVGLFAAYQAVLVAVRWHVSSQIESSIGGTLFDFELEDLDGKVWTRDALRGKAVVLNFFRSQCQGCQLESGEIRRFVREVDPAEVQVLGIMMDEVQGFSADATERTLVEFGYEHPVLMADDAFLDAFHGAGWAHVTPITYIADASGKIVAGLRGHQTAAGLRTLLP